MRLFLSAVFTLVAVMVVGQASYSVTSRPGHFETIEFYHDFRVSSAAYTGFDDFLVSQLHRYEPNLDLLSKHAELGRALAALEMHLPEGESLVVRFIEDNSTDQLANRARVELANYNFAERNYDKAIAYYASVPSKSVRPAELAEIRFKQGYALFVKKDFDSARNAFEQSLVKKTEYFFPANYYLGMCHFLQGDFDSAIASFEQVAQSMAYRQYVPYYTTLMYFALKRFEDVVAYAEPKLEAEKLFNEIEIRHLVGQAYFELEDYSKAVTYLEEYSSETEKLREEDFYQLAFSQYSTGACDKATENFKQIASLENPIGQRANFYIADCTLKSGDIRVARNAFQSVAGMSYDSDLQEEALFNYGKLSAQLKYDRDAILTLTSIDRSSPYYNEARNVLDDVFNLTSDYATALSTLDEMDNLSPSLKATYQRLSVLRGIQLYGDQDYSGADSAFIRSEKYPVDANWSAQALYWRSEIAHASGDYDSSRDLLNRYFSAARAAESMPSESSPALANYTQGYNYLYGDQFGTALRYFNETSRLLSSGTEAEHDAAVYYRQILPDANLRAGDCFFKLNRYNEAVAKYDLVIASEEQGVVYALYQKAIIRGLTGNPYEKVVLLDQIATSHSESQFADNALFQLAVTHLELGNKDKALITFRQLTDRYQTSELLNASYLRMGLIYFNDGELEKAIDNYKAVFDHTPSTTEAQEALNALEEIYVRELSQPDAYFAFAETIPGFEISRMRRDSVSYRTAEIQYENGRYKEAVVAFDKYLAAFPAGVNRVKALYYTAESYAVLDEFNNALEQYENVIAEGPGPYYIRALKKAATISYNFQENFYLAYNYYEQYSENVSDKQELHEAHLYMMRCAYRTERWADARQVGFKVLRYPNATDDEKGEASYCIAKAYYDEGDVDKAIAYFNDVTRYTNNALTAESRYLVARLYYDRDQLELAEQLCHNANAENSNYPVWVARGLILLSDIYVKKEDYFNARAPLEALVENFQGDQDILDEARAKLDAVRALEEESSRLKASSDTLELKKGNNDEGND